jgi:hypothetical protein
MLSFWSKKSPEPNKSSRNDSLISSGSAQSEKDRVTYASRDRKKDVQFVCHLPTGSRHAAQAQQIAGQIYTDTGPQIGLLGSGPASGQQLLESGEEDRHEKPQTRHEKAMAKQRQQQFSRHSQVARADSEDTDDGDDNESNSDIGPDDSISSVGRHAPSRYGATPHAEAAVKGSGFRKQSATHTTHYLEGNGRQLFVSAPNGSQEARLFDEVGAKANMAKDRVSLRIFAAVA